MFLYIRKCSLPVICMTAGGADVVLPQAQLHQLLQVQLPDQPVQRRALALNVQGHKKMCVFSNLLQSTVHIFSSRLYSSLSVDCTYGPWNLSEITYVPAKQCIFRAPFTYSHNDSLVCKCYWKILHFNTIIFCIWFTSKFLSLLFLPASSKIVIPKRIRNDLLTHT